MPKPVAVDRTPDLPKSGERIPIEHFHVSKMNIRFSEPFGETEADKTLIANVRIYGIVEPLLARPEGKGFGIYAGRRKYYASLTVGTKTFVVGQDCLIRNVSDEQAREQSLIDDLDVLREEMNPMVRARAVQDIIDSSMTGVRGVAKKLGVAIGTVSQWTAPLQLHRAMQDAVADGKIFFYDALQLVRMKPSESQEDRLVEVLEKGGRDAYLGEVQKLSTGVARRGIPKGKFAVVRYVYELAHEEVKYRQLEQLAKARNMQLDELTKWIVDEYLKSHFG